MAACGTHAPAPLPALGGPVPTHLCPFLTPSCPALDLELLEGTLLGAPLGTINIPGNDKWVLASFLSGCLPPCLVSAGVRGRLQGCLPCLNLGELLLCDWAVEGRGGGCRLAQAAHLNLQRHGGGAQKWTAVLARCPPGWCSARQGAILRLGSLRSTLGLRLSPYSHVQGGGGGPGREQTAASEVAE